MLWQNIVGIQGVSKKVAMKLFGIFSLWLSLFL